MELRSIGIGQYRIYLIQLQNNENAVMVKTFKCAPNLAEHIG